VRFEPYWYETGTPTFLVKLITDQKINILNLTDMQVGPESFRNFDIEETINALRRFLAAIPYDIIEKTENYYRTAIHLIFNILGLNCRSEVHTSNGRMDSLVALKNFVYCFEFKLDKTAD
jgi:hypothetical protein